MPTETAVIVLAITAAFVFFGLALAWASHRAG